MGCALLPARLALCALLYTVRGLAPRTSSNVTTQSQTTYQREDVRVVACIDPYCSGDCPRCKGIPLLVVIESPFSAPSRSEEGLHILYAREALRDSIGRGEAPIASHLLYTQVLKDSEPDERELGMVAGFAWGSRAELVAVYADLGISRGMRRGMQTYIDAGIALEMRYLWR